MSDPIPMDKLRTAWRLYDVAQAGGECGNVVDILDTAALLPWQDLRACHRPVGHSGPHACRWRGNFISWDIDGTQAGVSLRQVHLAPPVLPATPADPEEETAGAFLRRMGVDAALWAAEFAKRFGGDPTPGGWLHGWVCNMIEAGRSAGYSEHRREHLSRLQAGDGSAEPQVTGDPSRPNAGVDARHVVPAMPDTSHATAAEDGPLSLGRDIYPYPSGIPSYANAGGVLLRIEASREALRDASSPPADDVLAEPGPLCKAGSVMWPDDEQVDVECVLLAGHLGDHSEGAVTWPRDTDTAEVPDQHPHPIVAWALLQLSAWDGNPWEGRHRSSLRRLRDDTSGRHWLAMIGWRTSGEARPEDLVARELRRWLDSDEGREQTVVGGISPVLDRQGMIDAWPDPDRGPFVLGASHFNARHHAELLGRERGTRVSPWEDAKSRVAAVCGGLSSLRSAIQGTTGAVVALTPMFLANVLADRADRAAAGGIGLDGEPLDSWLAEILGPCHVAGVYACFPPVD